MSRKYRPAGLVCVTFFILALCLVLSNQVGAATLPDRRPALVGNGTNSLVNLIDAEGLFRKGQRDAWVMFEASIYGDGVVDPSEFSLFSPDSQLLRDEVRKRLRQSRFIPAVYKGRRTYAWFAGTGVYVVANGRPHIRVYAHQELEEIQRGADFIAPQLISPTGRGFIPNFPNYPSKAYHGNTGALVRLRHSVDANGKTTDVQVISETPTGHKFGETAKKMVRLLDFLPGYRNGQPAATSYILNWWFGRAMRGQ
jgi:TonB family protein